MTKQSKVVFLTLENNKSCLIVTLPSFFGVEAKRINEQMKRNKARFPEDFCFQLNS